MTPFQSLQIVDEFRMTRSKRKRRTLKLMLSTIMKLTASLCVLGMAQNSFAQDSTTTVQDTTVAPAPASTENTTTTTTTRNEDHKSSTGLFIEPMVLGASQNVSMKTSQVLPFVGNTSGTASGYGAGLRLGVHVTDAIFLGVDGRYDREQMQDSFYKSADAEVYNYGPTLGFQMPYLGLRLMGTYILGGQFNPAPGAGGLDLNFTDPRGYRLGAGIHVGPVSVNLEYQDLTYGNTLVESLGSLPVGTNVAMQTETNGYLLSLSFPLEL